MADRYFINGGVDAKWSTSGNWSATDGGGASGVKPTAADGVFFTANSPVCTVDTAGVGLTLNFTGYANTITMTAGLTISGSVTLVAAMTIAGASGLTINPATTSTATLISNGKTWPNSLTLNGNVSGVPTFAFSDAWDVNGSLTIATTGGQGNNLNGGQINVAVGLSSTGNGTCTGSSLIVLDGTGTWTGGSAIGNSVTINTAGTITLSGTIAYRTGTLTYTAGTVSTGGSLTCNLAATFAVNGITWTNVTLNPDAQTITLAENMNLTGTLTLGQSNKAMSVNGNTINTSEITCSTSLSVSGTTILNVNNTGTLSSGTGGTINNSIIINAPGKTVTIAATFRNQLNKFQYLAGTVISDIGTWLGVSPVGQQCGM
jgi:hypothetical protein